MTPEKFKRSDVTEDKFDAAASPLLDQVSLSLDSFFGEGYDASPFLLMLYEEKRIPFAERVAKAAFVDFIREALKRFPFVGNYDTHLFILRAIFGDLAEINFEVPDPGVLNVSVNAVSSLEFNFIGFTGVTDDNIFTHEGDQIVFRGLSGIETEAELELMFSEILPAGLSPHIALTFYERIGFLAEDPDGEFVDMIDHLGNDLVFIEVGG